METRITFIWIFIFSFCLSAWSQPTEITAEYGPPIEANVWEKFTFTLNAETFNVTEAELQTVLSGVTSFWIKTEMHTGNDIGGIDNVMIGSTYFSDFDGSYEGWSSGGDGTMEWMSTGGYEGGFLQISDWATGEYHWLISPSNWAGDWSSMIGQNIEFWYKTTQPSYAAEIKITSEDVNRLIINMPVSSTILPDDSVLIHLEVLPVPDQDVTVSFSTSDNNCIQVPSPIVVTAGNSIENVFFKAAPGAEITCTSVIEATSPGFLTSRVTMMVLDNYGIGDFDPNYSISVFPNPSNGKLVLSNPLKEEIQQLILYDLTGNMVLYSKKPDLSNTEIDISGQAAGIYFLKVFVAENVITLKVVID